MKMDNGITDRSIFGDADRLHPVWSTTAGQACVFERQTHVIWYCWIQPESLRDGLLQERAAPQVLEVRLLVRSNIFENLLSQHGNNLGVARQLVKKKS